MTDDTSTNVATNNKLKVEVLSLNPVRTGTVYGFATIAIPAMKLHIKEVVIHQQRNARWAQLPARPRVHNGQPVYGLNGKIIYDALFHFESKAVGNAFGRAVIVSLLEHFPNAFNDQQQEEGVV